jgi:hypothetical protein
MMRMRAGAIRDGPMHAADAGRTIAGLMRVSRSLRAALRPTLIGLILVAVATIGLMLIGQFFRLVLYSARLSHSGHHRGNALGYGAGSVHRNSRRGHS